MIYVGFGDTVTLQESKNDNEAKLQIQIKCTSFDVNDVFGDLGGKIENFVRILGADPNELDLESNDDRLDVDVCVALIEKFKCEEANRNLEETNNVDSRSLSMLNLLKDELNKMIKRKEDAFAGDEQSKKESRFKRFSYNFSSLCHLFFDLRVVAATLEHFGKEIKEATGKEVLLDVVCFAESDRET